MTRILVIEDNTKHLADARAFFEGNDDEVRFATCYRDAKELMFREYTKAPEYKLIRELKDIEGVISDIHFPLMNHPRYNQPEPIGVRVAIECTEAGLPFVLNTAGNHHGRRYQWINEMATERGWILIDQSSQEDPMEQEADIKDWALAYDCLMKRIRGEI